MPKSNRKQNQGSTGSRASRPTRGPNSRNITPLSANIEPQAPFPATATPTVPVPGVQRDLTPYDDFNGPAFIMPTWNDPVDSSSEVPRPAAQPFRQAQSSDTKQTASPMLKLVRKMRAAEQQRASAQLEEGLGVDKTMPSEARVAANPGLKPPSKAELTRGVTFKSKKAIPELELADQDWAAPLYTLANDPDATLSSQTTRINPESHLRQQSIVAVDGSADSSDDDVDALVKAIANMHPFQEIACSPPKSRVLKQESKVGAALKQDNIQTREDIDSRKAREVAVDTTKCSKKEAEEAEDEDAAIGLSKSSGSVESFASAASDDFERVEVPETEETEHNGAKRKWFKGYRR